jgi:hypothetical protein
VSVARAKTILWNRETITIVLFVYKSGTTKWTAECVRKTSCREEKRRRTFLLIETRTNQLLMRYSLCGPLYICACLRLDGCWVARFVPAAYEIRPNFCFAENPPVHGKHSRRLQPNRNSSFPYKDTRIYRRLQLKSWFETCKFYGGVISLRLLLFD